MQQLQERGFQSNVNKTKTMLINLATPKRHRQLGKFLDRVV